MGASFFLEAPMRYPKWLALLIAFTTAVIAVLIAGRYDPTPILDFWRIILRTG